MLVSCGLARGLCGFGSLWIQTGSKLHQRNLPITIFIELVKNRKVTRSPANVNNKKVNG